MPKKIQPGSLEHLQCVHAEAGDKETYLNDGAGLWLVVHPNGAKRWQYQFVLHGKRGKIWLGYFPTLSLADARKELEQVAGVVKAGKDPRTERAAEKLAAQFTAENTFTVVGDEWHGKELASGTWNPDHAARVMQRLRDDVYPYIGRLPVDSLKTRDLLVPVQAAARRGTLDLADRLRRYITGIMRHAVQTGRIQTNPALDLVGAIPKGKTVHRPALPLPRLPELLARIAGYEGLTVKRMAAQFALLTGARSSEFRFARWDEFDLEAGTWLIPAGREAVEGVRNSKRGEKNGKQGAGDRERVVYLARQAVALLHELHALNGRSLFVFQGQRRDVPLSENAINDLLRDVGYNTKPGGDVCLHGFRSMIVSSLRESGAFPHDAIKVHIGHGAEAGEEVHGIYARLAEHRKTRRVMLQWWADYLDTLQAAGRYIEPCDFNPNKAEVLTLHRAA